MFVHLIRRLTFLIMNFCLRNSYNSNCNFSCSLDIQKFEFDLRMIFFVFFLHLLPVIIIVSSSGSMSVRSSVRQSVTRLDSNIASAWLRHYKSAAISARRHRRKRQISPKAAASSCDSRTNKRLRPDYGCVAHLTGWLARRAAVTSRIAFMKWPTTNDVVDWVTDECRLQAVL